MSLTELKGNLHSKLLNIRNALYILSSEGFGELFDSSSSDDKIKLIENVENKYFLEHWVLQQRIKNKDYDNIPIKEIRNIARRLGVNGWRFLTKNQLVAEIKTKRNINESAS